MLFRYELRRFRRGLPLLALLFIFLVPSIYGALYLSANWDPYGAMDRLPVAIVNEDEPVQRGDTTLRTGADMTERLKDDRAFDWRETTREEAEEGLREGRYYLVLEIPAELSRDLVSPEGGGTPQQAQITLRRDDANGFVIGSVTNASQAKVEAAVNRSAIEAYFEAVFSSLGELRSGMVDAADGAAQLADGSASAVDGASRLEDGIVQAHDGSGRLAEGAGQLATGAGDLADGAAQADDGAQRLAEGAASAQDGAGRLADGLDQARGGSQALADGAGQLAENAPALRQGATDLSDGLAQLQTGSAELTDGATQVADGTQQLYDTVIPGLDQVIERQDAVAADVAAVDEDVQRVAEVAGTAEDGAGARIADAQAALAELADEDPTLAESEQYAALQEALTGADERVTAVAGRAEEAAATSAAANERVQGFVEDDVAASAKADLTDLNDGAHAVAAGAEKLQGGIGEAKDGADSLADGAGRFADGLEQLGSGATELDGGLAQLQDGAGELRAGLGTLDDGAHELASGLSDGADRVPALTEDERDEAALVMSRPVEAVMQVDNSAEVYGRGMAPMFFSIALWVFGIAAFNIMRPISGRLLAGRRNPVAIALAAWLPVGIVAVGGGLLMLAATLPLGLAPVHPVRAVALTVLVAVVFSLIAHLVQTALGTPGSALLLVLLVLQLASTGGTYPAEVLPGFFQALHPFMPMSYSIEAFRNAISGGPDQRFWVPVVVLMGIGAAALALDVLVVRRRRRFRMKDLHPALQA